MSKIASIFVIATLISIAATASTLFISSQNTETSCFKSDFFLGADIARRPINIGPQAPGTRNADSPPVYATERGFPAKYYRQAFPADCIFNYGGRAPTSSHINAANLVFDLLVWFVLALVVLLGFKKVKAKS